MLGAGSCRFERHVHAQHRAIHAPDHVRFHRPAHSRAADGALNPVVALIRPRQIDSHPDHDRSQQAAAYGSDARRIPTTQSHIWQHCTGVCRANFRLAGTLSPARQGLRGDNRQRPGVDLHRVDPPHASPHGSSASCLAEFRVRLLSRLCTFLVRSRSRIGCWLRCG